MHDSALFFITEAYSVVKVKACVCVCLCVCAPLFALLQYVSLVLHSQPAPLGLNHIPRGKTAASTYRLLCSFIFFFVLFVFFLGAFRYAWPPAASYTVVRHYLTVVDVSPVKRKKISLHLKGHYVVWEKRFTLFFFNIYSINGIIMQTLKYSFFLSMNERQAALRGK